MTMVGVKRGKKYQGMDDQYDMPDDNPFQTMYQRTMGASTGQKQPPQSAQKRQQRPYGEAPGTPPRPKTAYNHAFGTPQQAKKQDRGQYAHTSKAPKSEAKPRRSGTQQQKSSKTVEYADQVETTDDNRRFGGYKGHENQAEIYGIDPRAVIPLETGYAAPKQRRVTDRFVRYPYPSQQRSAYAQQYYSKIKRANIQSHKQAFNLEKEAKIINGNQMDLGTVNRDNYKGMLDPEGKRNRRDYHERTVDKGPDVGESNYKNKYPNWQNGQGDTFIEKAPQYPVYQQPFRGGSSYKQNFTEAQGKALKRQEQILAGLESNLSPAKKLTMTTYMPAKFEMSTTNADAFKDFKVIPVKDRAVKYAPNREPVKSASMTNHFRTTNQLELKKHKMRPDLANMIPYP